MGVRFSIIIPVYNVEKYITQCVESVLGQSYTNYEVILIDDGSTDGSTKICDNLSSNNEKISVIHQKNQGLSAARNAGIDSAIGAYLIFLDSDDYWDDENALWEISQTIDEKEVEVVTWSLKKFNEETGETVARAEQFPIVYETDKTRVLKDMLKKGLYRACACDKAVKRELIKEKSLYFRVGDTSEDIEWAAELAVCVKTVAVISKDFYVYRQRRGSITKTKSQKNINDLMKHIENCIHLGHTIDDEKFKEVYWSYVAEQYANMLIVFAMEKNMGENIAKEEKHKELLQYGNSLKTKICYWISKIIGIRGVVVLLKVILKLR